MGNKPEFDYTFKIVALGESGVGKSSIINRVVTNTFSSVYEATIGIDFCVKIFEVDGKRIRLQIWDTAGQEQFRTVVSNYYRNSQGVLLVYDCTSQRSFDLLPSWLEEVKLYVDEDCDTILIGNKCDAHKNKLVVQKSVGQRLAKTLNMPFYETSALSGANIEKVFLDMAKSIKNRFDNCDSTRPILPPKVTIAVSEKPTMPPSCTKEDSGGCC